MRVSKSLYWENMFIFILLLSLIVFPDISWFYYFGQIAFLFIFILWIIKSGFSLNWYLVWSSLFFIFTITSLLWSENSNLTIESIRNSLQLLLICNLLIIYLNNEEKKNNFYNTFIIVVILLALRLIITEGSWSFQRMGSSLGFNPNGLSIYFLFGILLSLNMYHQNKKKRIYLFVSIILIILTLFSGSRKAFFSLIFSISGYFLFKERKFNKKIILLLIIVITAWILYFISTSVPSLFNIYGYRIERFINIIFGRDDFDSSVINRLLFIQEGINLFLNKPLLGYGFGTYSLVSGFSIVSHNNYIELLVGVGSIGLLFYYYFILYLIKVFWRKWKTGDVSGTVFMIIILTLLILDMGIISYSNIIIQIMIGVCFINTPRKVFINSNIEKEA